MVVMVVGGRLILASMFSGCLKMERERESVTVLLFLFSFFFNSKGPAVNNLIGYFFCWGLDFDYYYFATNDGFFFFFKWVCNYLIKIQICFFFIRIENLPFFLFSFFFFLFFFSLAGLLGK